MKLLKTSLVKTFAWTSVLCYLVILEPVVECKRFGGFGSSLSRSSNRGSSNSRGTSRRTGTISGGIGKTHNNQPSTGSLGHTDLASLSYAGYRGTANKPKPQQNQHPKPSAPAPDPHQSAPKPQTNDPNRPIGWNVNSAQQGAPNAPALPHNAAPNAPVLPHNPAPNAPPPYGSIAGHNPSNVHGAEPGINRQNVGGLNNAAPPPYGQAPPPYGSNTGVQHGPPPAYSPAAGANPYNGQYPPAYSPQQNYGHIGQVPPSGQHASLGGYPGYHPQAGGYPNQGYHQPGYSSYPGYNPGFGGGYGGMGGYGGYPAGHRSGGGLGTAGSLGLGFGGALFGLALWNMARGHNTYMNVYDRRTGETTNITTPDHPCIGEIKNGTDGTLTVILSPNCTFLAANMTDQNSITIPANLTDPANYPELLNATQPCVVNNTDGTAANVTCVPPILAPMNGTELMQAPSLVNASETTTVGIATIPAGDSGFVQSVAPLKTDGGGTLLAAANEGNVQATPLAQSKEAVSKAPDFSENRFLFATLTSFAVGYFAYIV